MKALILIDVQRDFLPGGALAVPQGNEIVPVLNGLMPQFERIVATMDWHPKGHASFASAQGKPIGSVAQVHGIAQILWPDHCVQGTLGAELAPGLNRTPIESIFYKGTNPLIDSYSAFFDQARKQSTGLAEYLRTHRCEELYFGGLATDYCVLYSVLDALELGFRVTVIRDACRAINHIPGNEEKAFLEMEQKGAKVITM